MRVLSARRSAPADPDPGKAGSRPPGRRVRLAFRVVKVLFVVVVVLAVGFGLLFVLTPSAGQA